MYIRNRMYWEDVVYEKEFVIVLIYNVLIFEFLLKIFIMDIC